MNEKLPSYRQGISDFKQIDRLFLKIRPIRFTASRDERRFFALSSITTYRNRASANGKVRSGVAVVFRDHFDP